MKNFFNKNKTIEQACKETRVKEYINKYIKELQRHFDITDRRMRIILYKVYQDLGPFNLIKKWIYMLKSRCIEKINLKEKINGS